MATAKQLAALKKARAAKKKKTAQKSGLECWTRRAGPNGTGHLYKQCKKHGSATQKTKAQKARKARGKK